MKTFFILLSGVLFTLVASAAVFFYFLQGTSVPRPSEIALDPADTFTFKMTFNVPPPLQSEVQSGKNVFWYTVLSYPEYLPVAVRAIKVENPVFPLKAEFKIDRRLISSAHNPLQKFFIYSAYLKENSDEPDFFQVPGIHGAKRVFLGNQSFSKAEVGSGIDVGNVYLAINFTKPRTYKCAPGASEFSGKITPTKAFLEMVGTSKTALVAFPRMAASQSYDFNPVDDGALDSVASHYQFLDLTRGPAAFSFSPATAVASFYRIVIVECKEGENLRKCAAGAFPFQANEAESLARKRFRVVGEKFEIPHCGQNNFQGYVHLPALFEPARGVPVPNPSGAVAPQEFVSGENI